MRDLHTTGVVRYEPRWEGIAIELRCSPDEPMQVVVGPERAEELGRALLALAAEFVADEHGE